MNLTSSEPLPQATPESHWSLAAVRPGPLAARIASAALVVGVVGGMASACLTLLFGASTADPVARFLALGLPLVLVAMIGWRLSAVTDDGAPRSGRRLAWTAGVAVALISVVQAWPELGAFDLDGTARGVMAVVFYGALFGLVPAAAGAVVLITTALALHAARSRLSLRSAEVGLVAVVMLLATAYDLWGATGVHDGNATGMAAALAGTGAALTARWCLVGRQPHPA